MENCLKVCVVLVQSLQKVTWAHMSHNKDQFKVQHCKNWNICAFIRFSIESICISNLRKKKTLLKASCSTICECYSIELSAKNFECDIFDQTKALWPFWINVDFIACVVVKWVVSRYLPVNWLSKSIGYAAAWHCSSMLQLWDATFIRSTRSYFFIVFQCSQAIASCSDALSCGVESIWALGQNAAKGFDWASGRACILQLTMNELFSGC